jgi:hypothetical protein
MQLQELQWKQMKSELDYIKLQNEMIIQQMSHANQLARGTATDHKSHHPNYTVWTNPSKTSQLNKGYRNLRNQPFRHPTVKTVPETHSNPIVSLTKTQPPTADVVHTTEPFSPHILKLFTVTSTPSECKATVNVSPPCINVLQSTITKPQDPKAPSSVKYTAHGTVPTSPLKKPHSDSQETVGKPGLKKSPSQCLPEKIPSVQTSAQDFLVNAEINSTRP